MLPALALASTATAADSVELEITTEPGLRFSVTRFAVEPGAEVKLTLTNPDEMQHNFLITEPGQRLAVVNAATALGPAGLEQDYVPDTDAVLFHSPVLNPHESETLNFTAPQQEGVYPYVCTVPGHGFVMYGAMYVTQDPDDLPPREDDPHLPDINAAAAAATEHEGHDDALTGPRIRRTFLPGASPAAIAVHTGRGLSFCWDAGTNHLRYAWQGGFVDSEAHWQGNGSTRSQVEGDIYFRAPRAFPLRLGDVDHIGERDFRGYRMIDGLPEFHYKLDGKSVRQHITALPQGLGLTMQFEIENVDAPVYYVTEPTDDVAFASSAGEWEGGVLRLTAEEARAFTITLSARSGATETEDNE